SDEIAKEEVAEFRRGMVGTSPIYDIYRESTHHSDKATYRLRAGSRGSPFTAIIRKGTPDPQAALEVLLGQPVIGFKITPWQDAEATHGATPDYEEAPAAAAATDDTAQHETEEAAAAEEAAEAAAAAEAQHAAQEAAAAADAADAAASARRAAAAAK